MLQDSHRARIEQQILEFYSLIGHQVKRIVRRGDRASDFIIEAKDGEKRVTRCALRDEVVDDKHVRALYQVMHDEGATQAALITTGSLSAKAQRIAKGKPIRLADWSEFESLLRRARAQAQKHDQASIAPPIQPETLRPQVEADTLLARSDMGAEVERPPTRLAGFRVGFMLGRLLSLLYLAFVVVVVIVWDIVASVNASYAIPISTLWNHVKLVMFLGFLVGGLATIIIGPVTGWLIAVVVTQFRKHLSRRAAYLIGTGISFGIALVINIYVRFRSLQPDGLWGYYFLMLGMPSIVYVLAGGFMGLRLYDRNT